MKWYMISEGCLRRHLRKAYAKSCIDAEYGGGQWFGVKHLAIVVGMDPKEVDSIVTEIERISNENPDQLERIAHDG